MYQPHDGPQVPVAAVHELLTAIGEALSTLRPSSSDAGMVDLWAEVKVRVCALPGSFELNANYPTLRDEANLSAIRRDAAAITAQLARHAHASQPPARDIVPGDLDAIPASRIGEPAPVPLRGNLLGRLVERADDDSECPLVGEIIGIDAQDGTAQGPFVTVAWGQDRHHEDGSASGTTEALDELRPARERAR